MRREFEVCDFCQWSREGLKTLLVPAPLVRGCGRNADDTPRVDLIPSADPSERKICIRCYRAIEKKYYEFEKELKGELKYEQT